MVTLTNTRGETVDLTTGEIVGRAEGAPTEVAPRRATRRDGVGDRYRSCAALAREEGGRVRPRRERDRWD